MNTQNARIQTPLLRERLIVSAVGFVIGAALFSLGAALAGLLQSIGG
jgi:hypothetical protein